MKKLFVSIFAFFYLGLSCGFAFNMHFCMGRLSSVEFFHTGNNTCETCGMKYGQGCCHSKLTVVKITDSHQSSSAEINIHPPFAALIKYAPQSIAAETVHLPGAAFADTSPPPVTGSFLCILNSIFII